MQFFDTLSNVRVGNFSLASILSALVTLLICVLVIRLVMRLAERGLSRSKLDESPKKLVRSALRTVLRVIMAIIVAEALGINTTSLVAVVSVAGLALSLSVQNLLSNLFSGLTLFAVHPFKPGDWVTIGESSGTVRSIGLFYTVIDTIDNRRISIPNSDVTESSVINFDAEPLRRTNMTFSASYDSPTEAVRAAILDAVAMDERILSEPEPFIAISAYQDSCIDYVVRVWCKSEDFWDVYFGLNEHVRESFAKNGVEMTYNHVNVHMMQ